MQKSWLPQGGANLFQAIKARRTAAEAAGINIVNLGVGQPEGPALQSAREAAAEAVLSDQENMHEYQDNSVLPLSDFAQRFIRCHISQANLARHGAANLAYLPIPGIKPILEMIPLACGAAQRKLTIATTTDPGYPTPAVWAKYLRQIVAPIRLDSHNEFRFSMDDVAAGTELIMCNYPHNPSGQVATAEMWHNLCRSCEATGIRLFNDAAYAALAHTDEHCNLADVAIYYPRLSWCEAYSASKAGNFTGWRVGAMVGSPDFIGNIATIKGNTDSGLFAPAAIGVIHAFENDRASINAVRNMYGNRITGLINALSRCGMKLAVQPGAGFFTLWQAPKRAFGRTMSSAEEFNFAMIEATGVIGVHFDPYIRYAVCGSASERLEEIAKAFEQANVNYLC
jgi:LL-diaminopimelate aminotransferase